MKWDAKDCLLALFLCLGFVLVVGYGACSFGGDDMELWQKILIITSFAVPMLCISILIGHQIWAGKKPKTNKTCEALQSMEFTVQDGCSNPRKISVSGIQINCKQGEAK